MITTWILQLGDGVIMFIVLGVWYCMLLYDLYVCCMFVACLLYVYCWFHHMTIFFEATVTSAACRPIMTPSWPYQVLRHSNLSVSETPL